MRPFVAARRWLRFDLPNWWRDLLARLRGRCNDCPWRPSHDGGGYHFWRCALRRGHPGLHRRINYVWDDTGQTDYVPVPPHNYVPSSVYNIYYARPHQRRAQRRARDEKRSYD